MTEAAEVTGALAAASKQKGSGALHLEPWRRCDRPQGVMAQSGKRQQQKRRTKSASGTGAERRAMRRRIR